MPEPLGPDLCYALAARRKARYLSRAYDSRLAPAGLSISQFSILSMLHADQSLKLLELADRLVMERTSLVRALKPLQTAGWVVCERLDGGRSLSARLSPSGLQKIREATPLWLAAQAAYEDQVGRENAVQLRKQILELKLTG